MAYDFKRAHQLCKQHNLVFNETIATMSSGYFEDAKLDQSQADKMMELWVRGSCFTWDRRNYPWLTRISIALYFLGFFTRVRSW